MGRSNSACPLLSSSAASFLGSPATTPLWVALTAATWLGFLLSCIGGRKDPYKAVSSKDRDGDGRVSPEEWTQSPAIFEKIDKDKDGYLSPEDFAEHWGQTSSEAGREKAPLGPGRNKIWK